MPPTDNTFVPRTTGVEVTTPIRAPANGLVAVVVRAIAVVCALNCRHGDTKHRVVSVHSYIATQGTTCWPSVLVGRTVYLLRQVTANWNGARCRNRDCCTPWCVDDSVEGRVIYVGLRIVGPGIGVMQYLVNRIVANAGGLRVIRVNFFAKTGWRLGREIVGHRHSRVEVYVVAALIGTDLGWTVRFCVECSELACTVGIAAWVFPARTIHGT